MSKVGTLKKAETEDDGWEIYGEPFKTWEAADAARLAIALESNYSARVRYAQPFYLVEWKR